MPEDNEGLEPEELLKDIDVPTAAKAMREQRGYPDIEVTAFGKSNLNEEDELVRGKDHEEALKEAVQQARKQERRRIQEKIKEEVISTKKAAENAGVAVHDLHSCTAITALNEIKKELEEEAGSKTGDSDNFGETDNEVN